MHYDDPEGNLYDGKYLYYGGGAYTLLDFDSSVDYLYGLEEGTDVGHTDIFGVTAVANQYGGSNQFYTRLQTVVNTENFHKHLAAEQWVGHVDGYAMNTNNNRVYFDPTTGLMDFITWDLDFAFNYDYSWGMDWHNPRGRLASLCWSHAGCAAAQGAAVQEMVDHLDSIDLEGFYQQLHKLTYDEAISDPRSECGSSGVMSDPSSGREYLLGWIQGRSDFVRSEWGL